MPNARFRLELRALEASSRPPVSWAPVNDHRCFSDKSRGLFYVADGFGPTYGGYFAPFGMDPGLAKFVSSFDGTAESGEARLRAGLQAAHLEMRALEKVYNSAFERLLQAGETDRIRAAARASDEVRPPAWSDYQGRSLAHFGASVTAGHVFGESSLAIAQVGTCRAYLQRAGHHRQLMPDHSLATMHEQAGEPLDRDSLHSAVPTRLLGVINETVEVDTCVVGLQSGDFFALCSSSVWRRGDATIGQLFQTKQSVSELELTIAECARAAKHDATAVVIEVLG